MNATKFVVLLIFVGVVCANVGARQLDEVSQKTRFGISIPETVTTNGIDAERIVSTGTSSYNTEYTNSNANGGPSGPSSSSSGSVNKYAYEYVTADGPNARADTSSYTFGSAGSNAAAGPKATEGDAYSYGDAGSSASGSTDNP
ncbi:hypothetical protein Bca4012_100409 [Brassica carinata]|uniref:Uncharacterized protein n=2 Tax=Brassica TaxID=3705 RepID=A0A8X7TSN1_BRACI|nr:hypothetical protein Bca52824_082948 [Brassica carinata]VDD62815.1 unnamed protein product [Brassica oleracea]